MAAVAGIQFCLWAVSPSVGSVFSKIGSLPQAMRLMLRHSMLHAPCRMLTSDLLQRSNPGVVIRTKLPEAYRQRPLICAVTFHTLGRFCVSPLHAPSPVLLAPFTSYRALGAPVTFHFFGRRGDLSTAAAADSGIS